jgi:hypothetical protein
MHELVEHLDQGVYCQAMKTKVKPAKAKKVKLSAMKVRTGVRAGAGPGKLDGRT